jgi:acetylornithine/N-succinyldiaminopimelate aminotransferase
VPGDQGGTYHGNPLMCAAGLAILDAVTRSGFLEHTRARGQQLLQGLQAIADRLGTGPVRGRGLLLALDLPGPDQAAQVADTLRRQADGRQPGLLLNAVRPGSLRFVPALNIGADEVDLGLQLLRRALGL